MELHRVSLLVFVILFSASGLTDAVQELNSGIGAATTFASSNFGNDLVAAEAATAQIGSRLVAKLEGTGAPDAADVGAIGYAYLEKVSAAVINVKIEYKNLTGSPFKEHVRIGTGPYLNNIVLGVPDANPTTNRSGWSKITTKWNETALFPRIPYWPLSKIFDFLYEDPASFYFSMSTSAYISGAVRGTLNRYP